jgi:hypothetical protein
MSVAALLRRVDQSAVQLSQIDQAVAELHREAAAIAVLLNRRAAHEGAPVQASVPDAQTPRRGAPHRQAVLDATLIEAVAAAIAAD